MLFSFPPPRCEPGEALLSQTSSRPFYHCLDLDECGRRAESAARPRPPTVLGVRTHSPSCAHLALLEPPLAPAQGLRRSHLLTVRDGLGRRGRDRGGKKRRASQVRRLARHAPPRYTRPCASPLVSGLPGLLLRLSPPGALFSSSQLFALCQELSSPCKHQAGLFQRPRNVSGA